MPTTTMMDGGKTEAPAESRQKGSTQALTGLYNALLEKGRVQWTTYHRFEKELGRGGQGTVYLSQRKGADGFNQPVAMKVFSPEHFPNMLTYEKNMVRIAHVASRIATIQHDNLLNVQDFVDQNRIRIMVMEWIDGFDLRQLLNLERLQLVKAIAKPRRWEYIEQVVATFGPKQTRVKAGVAVAIARDCLAALAALHREGIVHSDIKPANIMLKKTGHTKLIDMGSAFELADPPEKRACTPTYAAPEVLEGAHCTEQSDLASLGYVLVEMLAGKPCFQMDLNYQELLTAKRSLPQRLKQLLPPEVACNSHLVNLCKKLIATDPAKRFTTAEAAEFREGGAAEFHRQLVFGDLASEYENDIRVLLEEVCRIDDQDLANDPTQTWSTNL
ncbi:MAG: serine/threonine-protein kinase [Planctomycetota bacterium]